MSDRRIFLRQALWLGSAGLYSGLVSCAGSSRPITAVAAAPAPQNVVPPPPKPVASAPATMEPPPDIFDASLIDASFWQRPRTISLYRPASNENISILYWKDGVVVDGAYDRLCHILRDVQADVTVKIDPKLLETLWACEAFCARYGIKHPLEILSGYRTPATNKKISEAGLPAARKSLHMSGMAADMRIVDLHPEVLGDLVRSFARGGVGFYFRPGTHGGWIHTDTGANRIWHG